MSEGVVLRDDEVVALADASMDDAPLPLRAASRRRPAHRSPRRLNGCVRRLRHLTIRGPGDA
jgi:hypothetical protein